MTDWEKINELSLEACDLPEEQRASWLAENCPPWLLSEVESLVSNEKLASDIFESPAIFRYAGLLAADEIPDSKIDRKFGKYRIIEEIASGGMGAVYLGERIDGSFNQKVAIKIIRQSFFDSYVEKRFLAEQQILASLNHQNIAKLFDGGFSDNGEPYLIMEHIEGKPLLQYAEDNYLSTKGRLVLFLQICSAVVYAHQNLTVHRDIKPSNILVTSDGKPILIDFGLAKVLEKELDPNTTQTRFVALTPAYASPEQMQNEPISTASDTYSLGVVLYELLTGTLPFNNKEKTLAEIVEHISRFEAPKPSDCIRSYSDSESVVTSSQLRGDLDTIILKALRYEPENRYKSVEQMANDIELHLDGLPVKACSRTLKYQASKFYQRNKIALLAGALTLIGLLTGIGIAISQALVAKEQARVASEAKGRAETAAKKSKEEMLRANKITKFMEKLISYANPGSYAVGAKSKGQAKVIDVLDEMGKNIDVEFANQADIQAELHHKFAEVYTISSGVQKNPERRQELLEKQRFHAGRALKLRRQFYGDKHELVAKDLFYFSTGRRPDDPRTPQLLAEAIVMMRETNPENLNFPYMLTSYARRLYDPEITDEVSKAYRNAVIPNTAENKYQIAERYYREAQPVFRKHYGESHVSIVDTSCRLASLQTLQEKRSNYRKEYENCQRLVATLDDGPSKTYYSRLLRVIENRIYPK